jgi:cytochrome c oxidase assembly protein subunit 15
MKAFAEALPSAGVKYARYLSKFSRRNVLLVATTVISGAFVAGNDAGRAYNSFPLMGDRWIPKEILDLEPKWRNIFENTATVQFNHRVLALTTYISITTMTLQAYNRTVLWKQLPSLTKNAIKAIFAVGGAQVALGISTLLLYVPIELAAIHQVRMLFFQLLKKLFYIIFKIIKMIIICFNIKYSLDLCVS